MRGNILKLPESNSFQDDDKEMSRVGINLKGLKHLLEIKSKKRQFDYMIDFIRSNKCEVVMAEHSSVDVIDLELKQQA